MKVQPNDIRYMVITKKTVITKDGVKELPHILSDNHTRHDDAIAARPANIPSKVAGYVRNDRCIRPTPSYPSSTSPSTLNPRAEER